MYEPVYLRMVYSTILVSVLFPRFTSGENYCSTNGTSPFVNCVPCSNFLSNTDEKCNSTCYYCPIQCGNSVDAGLCKRVCGNNCFHGRCKYLSGSEFLQCLDCKRGFTGKTCLELCPERCLECNQYNSVCTSCKENYSGPNCTATKSRTPMTHNASPSTSVNIYNCSMNCTSCDTYTGSCTECTTDRYGDRCQHSCDHCNASLCSSDESCLKCINNNSLICNTSQSKAFSNTSEICSGVDCWGIDRFAAVVAAAAATAVVLFALCIVGVKYRQLLKRHCAKRGQCCCGTDHDQTSNGYTYIDDNELDSYHSRPNSNGNTSSLCHTNSHPGSIGSSSAHTDGGNGSDATSGSGTIFGNLFETGNGNDADCDMQAGQLNYYVDEADLPRAQRQLYTIRYLTVADTQDYSGQV